MCLDYICTKLKWKTKPFIYFYLSSKFLSMIATLINVTSFWFLNLAYLHFWKHNLFKFFSCWDIFFYKCVKNFIIKAGSNISIHFAFFFLCIKISLIFFTILQCYKKYEISLITVWLITVNLVQIKCKKIYKQ